MFNKFTTNLKVGSSQNWGCHIREKKIAGGLTLDGMYLRDEIRNDQTSSQESEESVSGGCWENQNSP